MEHGRANCCWLPLKDLEVEEGEQKMSRAHVACVSAA